METPRNGSRLRLTVRRAVHLLAGLAALAVSLPARAEPAQDPKRYFNIPKWYVDYTIHVHGEGQTGKGKNITVWRIDRSYSGRYVLDEPVSHYYAHFKVEDLPKAFEGCMGWGFGWDKTKVDRRQQVRIDDELKKTGKMPVEGDVTEDYLDRETWQGAGERTGGWEPGVYVNTVKKIYCLRLPYLSRGGGRRDPTFVHELHVVKSGEFEPDTSQDEIDPSWMTDAVPAPPVLMQADDLVTPDAPLPPKGSTLSGSLSLPGRISGGVGKGPREVPVEIDVTWTCSPTPGPDIELVVSLKGDGGETYPNWAPVGGAAKSGLFSETTPGNDIVATAELRKVGTGEAVAKADVIHFELTGVSREKGVCMNAPQDAKGAPDPDLKFIPERNPKRGLICGSDGQGASEAAGANPIATSTATVTSFDYGAWGDLKVTARLQDGRTIVGHLEGFKDIEVIPLPKRQGGSKIADCWLRDNKVTGKSDNADDEEVPSGDGSNGDGLTLYEEYRGFADGGVWTPGNPTRKDFFICDMVGARSKEGIDLFAGITQLNVHDDLHVWELSKDRVVNFNHSAGPHRVDQHGIVLVRGFFEAAAKAVPNRLPEPDGSDQRPGTPKDIQHVFIGTGFSPTTPFQKFTVSGRVLQRDRWAEVIAHELCHCCNVWHHGEHDEQVVWDTAVNANGGNVLLFESPPAGSTGSAPTQIVMLQEDGTLKPNVELRQPRKVGVGVPHEQHSGAEDCVMRYTNATCYRSTNPGESQVRYMVLGREVTGNTLCENAKGTGCNDPLHKPQSRYGDAHTGRGGCRYQICVNDALTPPSRAY